MDSLAIHVSVAFDYRSSCCTRNASVTYSLLVNHKQLNKLIIIPGVAPLTHLNRENLEKDQ